MKRLTLVIAILCAIAALGIRVVQGQTASAPKHVAVWQYGTFYNNSGYFGFNAAARKIPSGASLDAFMKTLTGKDFVGKATIPDVLDALGAEGWELIQVHEPTDYYFKRLAP
jgi:hypothetical protein